MHWRTRDGYRVARKYHACEFCHRPIRPGKRYYRIVPFDQELIERLACEASPEEPAAPGAYCDEACVGQATFRDLPGTAPAE